MKRLKNDPEMTAFMKAEDFYVKDMNAVPEIRVTVPGYLSRSGFSSAFDINFGRDAGASAVLLLVSGFKGVTVINMANGNVKYISTKNAIKQRQADDKMISLYEELGVCFGRKPVPYQPSFSQIENVAWRYLQLYGSIPVSMIFLMGPLEPACM